MPNIVVIKEKQVLLIAMATLNGHKVAQIQPEKLVKCWELTTEI